MRGVRGAVSQKDTPTNKNNVWKFAWPYFGCLFGGGGIMEKYILTHQKASRALAGERERDSTNHRRHGLLKTCFFASSSLFQN